MRKDGLDERTRSGGRWTGVEGYLVALARRRTARHKREGRPHSRMDDDGPRNTIGAIPFIVMMIAFALLVIAIAALAWPTRQPSAAGKAGREVGTAPPGWLDRAEREMTEQR